MYERQICKLLQKRGVPSKKNIHLEKNPKTKNLF